MILNRKTWDAVPIRLIPAMSSNTQDGFTASSTDNATGYQPYMAFDGDDTTFWFSNVGTVPQSIQIELPRAKTITQVNYKVGATSGTGSHKGKVQLRVNGEWQDVASFDFSASSSPQEFTAYVPSVRADAARILYTEGAAYSGGYVLKSVYTLQAYGY